MFTLTIGAVSTDTLKVTGFAGEEGISKLFKFDVDVIAPPGTREADFLGQRAVFTIDRAPLPRAVHGIVGRVTALGITTRHGEPVVRVRVVPPLWLAKRRIASRVFQDTTVPEVVKALLSPPGKKLQRCELDLRGRYAKRDYCVQYQESDYDFVRRILAEEGISFHFGYSDAPGQLHEDVMVLVDAVAGYATYGRGEVPALRLAARSLDHAAATSTDVSWFQLAHAVRSNRVMLKDHDFQRPRLDLRAEAAPIDSRLEELRVYEHRGDYLHPDATQERADRRLEQLRRRALQGDGESTAPFLLPGHRFRLDADQDVQGLGGDYVVTRIRHEGHTPEYSDGRYPQAYKNTFSCVRADVPYRPKRPAPVVRQVLESAVVVGPEEGTVYTDPHGRVRVQFHWDLDGSFDEHSTTWLRVVQGWAGPSFGWHFVPRVGMEVMVSFLGGDPDCPVVLGAIHNGTNPHPFRLPDEATRSGLRTRSWPGGQGFNELSFDDASGSEQIFLHAQNDLEEHVLHDRTATVGKSDVLDVGDDRKTHVGGDREDIVDGASSRVVGGDETVEVKGSRATAVGGNERTSIEDERSVTVGAGERTEVRGAASWTVHDDLTVRADGSHTTIVGKPEAKRSYVVHVEGTTDLYSTGLTEIVAKEGIRLRCGESLIDVSPKRIEIVSPHVVLRSPESLGARVAVEGDQLNLFSRGDAIVKSGHVLLATKEGASLSLKTEARVAGQKIHLGSPETATDPLWEPPIPPTVITVVDADKQPIKNRRIVLEMDDGSERSFVLDGEGRAEIHDLEGPPCIRFPGLTHATKA